MNDTPSDILCWNAFRSGDRQAFESLFRRYYPILLQYGTKIYPDKERVNDCIQDLFIELWQSKASTPVQSVRAYFLKAIKYKIFRLFKTSKPHLHIDEWQETLPFELSHDHFIITREDELSRVKTITDAIENLPGRQKEIIYLKIYQQLSYEELSEVMNINYQVARNLYSQSLRSLRQLLMPN